jgi:hypothetical protein
MTAYAGARLGLRCSTCAHFRRGPAGDSVVQCHCIKPSRACNG